MDFGSKYVVWHPWELCHDLNLPGHTFGECRVFEHILDVFEGEFFPSWPLFDSINLSLGTGTEGFLDLEFGAYDLPILLCAEFHSK